MHPTHRLSAFMLLALLVLGCGKKPTPDADPVPEAQPTPSAQGTAGATGIEGTYLLVGGEMMGEKATDADIAKESELDRTVKISKDRIQLKLFKRHTLEYKLDPSKSPAEIDLFEEEPGKKSRGNYGIYKVEGDTLTLFIMGADEPQLRPREFKTLTPRTDPKEPARRVGGAMIVVLKKVSDDTTFISEPPPEPKPPAVDVDGPIVAELMKKGFTAEKNGLYGKFSGVAVTVPSTLPLDVIKELSGQPRIRGITFKKKLYTDPDHPVTDEAIQTLNKLDGLTYLTFESCPKITAAAFHDLSRFPQLTHVQVSSSPLDDAATEELAKVKTLEWVNLDGAKFTDKSLANLAKIRTLKTIILRDATVTGSGIKLLNALPDLDFLALQGMPSMDTALGELNPPKLRTLNMAQSNITDESLGKLPVLPMLESILLSGPKLTDAGLKHLHKQPSLRSVTFFGTEVTEAGIEELKKLKPKLSITRIK